MLAIVIKGDEFFDENKEEFFTTGDAVLEFEHSLVSLSKWESEIQKPFLGVGEKTPDEIFAYIRYMLLTQNVPSETLLNLSQDNLNRLNEYIDSPQSATTFGDMPDRGGRGEIITSELIYYWMVSFTIPFDCQNWHLNRLFSLIKICNIKGQDPKKQRRSNRDIAQRNRDLNAKRKEQLGTEG